MKHEVLDDARILLIRSRVKIPFKLTVSGISMFPVLKEGDRIIVCPKDTYEIGDILVFIYEQNEILAHRLLKIENGQYYCKGDNSFRIEIIEKNKVVGAVNVVDDPHRTLDFIEDSYAVSQILKKHGYSFEVTKKDPQYKQYCQKYLCDSKYNMRKGE